MSIKNIIKPGNILKLNVLMPHDDSYKSKYFIVVCDEPLLLLKINTSKEQRSISKKHHENLFRLPSTLYSLEYDSYLDCGTAWYGLVTIKEIINQNPEILSELTSDHKNEVIRLTGKSRSISPKHKRLIRDNLRKQ